MRRASGKPSGKDLIPPPNVATSLRLDWENSLHAKKVSMPPPQKVTASTTAQIIYRMPDHLESVFRNSSGSSSIPSLPFLCWEAF